jgi:hypothetical protein
LAVQTFTRTSHQHPRPNCIAFDPSARPVVRIMRRDRYAKPREYINHHRFKPIFDVSNIIFDIQGINLGDWQPMVCHRDSADELIYRSIVRPIGHRPIAR